jgi:hypothetical protein
MEQDDPEERIAYLERQLSDVKPLAAPTSSSQRTPAPPPRVSCKAPRSFRSGKRPMLLAALGLGVASVVVAAIVVVTIFGNPFSSPQLQTVDGVHGLLARMRSQFGDTMGYSLTVFRDHADVARVDPTDQRRLKRYTYGGGDWSEHRGSSVSSSDALADLGNFDAAAVLTTMQGAAKSLGLNSSGDTYLIARGVPGGALDLSAHVTDHGLNGYVEINQDGSVKELHPPS